MSFDFEPEEFRSLCAELGEQIGWERRGICPCTDPVSAGRNRQCPLCGGAGYIYAAVTGIGDYRALIRQVDERKEYVKYGQLYLGDITITTMPDEMAIGEGDLVTLLTRRFRREEIVTHGASDVLRWTPVAELLSVRSLESEYEIGTDVELSGDELSWLTGEPPAAGSRLTVSYWWTPRYLVQPSMVTGRRPVDGVYLPQRVVGRLKGREEFRE